MRGTSAYQARLGGAMSRQRGQAMVFVVVMLPIVLLAGIFMFQSGKLTSEKMQLQNAADATAFSLSTLEARDLNFLSYINRAVVANEIGIAQMAGLAAWSDMWTNVPDKLREFDAKFLAGPTLGISSSIINPLTGGIEAVANPVKAAVWGVGRVVVPVLTGTNHFILNYSAQFYHLSTLFQMGAAVKPLIQGNACPFPDEQGDDCGAKLSDFGLLMMMSHFATYVDLVGNKVLNPFVRRYAMGGSIMRAFNFLDDFYANTTDAFMSQADGFERLASIIRESRDPFTRGMQMGRARNYVPSRIGVRWSPLSILGELGLPYSEPDGLCMELLIIEGCVNFFIRAGRFGGAELRYEEAILGALPGNVDRAFTLCQRSGACKAQNLATGEEYNWSAAEITTAGFNLALKLRVIWPFESPWTAFNLGLDLNFGTGAAQVGRAKGRNLLKGGEFSTPGGFGINVPLNDGYFMYGDAVNSIMTWNDPIPPQGPAFALMGMSTGKPWVMSSYLGLPTYHDVRTVSVDDNPDGRNPYGNEHGFLAPYLVVGLIKGVNPTPGTGSSSNPEWYVNEPDGMKAPVGQFELIDREAQNEGADNELGVIARSEVYFSRPTNLSQFARVTQQNGWPLDVPPSDATEYGSLFSPYWQARLVDTDYATRAAALLVQQGQVYADDNRAVAVSIEADATKLAEVLLDVDDEPVSFGVTGRSNYQESTGIRRPGPLIHRRGSLPGGYFDERVTLNPLAPYDQ